MSFLFSRLLSVHLLQNDRSIIEFTVVWVTLHLEHHRLRLLVELHLALSGWPIQVWYALSEGDSKRLGVWLVLYCGRVSDQGLVEVRSLGLPPGTAPLQADRLRIFIGPPSRK